MSKPKNSFDSVLRDLNGSCARELFEQLQTAIAEVKTHNKSASLKLEMCIKPRNRGKQVDVEHEITVKLPKKARISTVFYVAEDNTLQRNDPDQAEMELRSLPDAPTEFRKIV